MNKPRRSLHRIVWLVLMIAIPVLIFVSIHERNPVPAMPALPNLDGHEVQP